jgi:hypothetical protein
MDPEAQRPEIEILEAQQPDFAGAQPMAVGDQEQRTIARIAPYDGKQPGEFIEGEETDRLGGRAGHRRRIARRGTAQNNRSEQFHRPPARHPQAKSAPRPPRFFTVMGSSVGSLCRFVPPAPKGLGHPELTPNFSAVPDGRNISLK